MWKWWRGGVGPMLAPGRRAIALLVAALTLVACSPVQEAQRDTPASAASDFNEADVTFARAMIPHGEQGADMSELVLEVEGLEPGVRSLARELVDNRHVETEQLEQWVATHGEPLAAEAPGHSHGGGEDGIATPAQMYTLDQAEGTAAQSLYVEMMIKHHRGAVVAAREEIARGQNHTLVEFARMILRTREAQLQLLVDAAARATSATPPDGKAQPRRSG